MQYKLIQKGVSAKSWIVEFEFKVTHDGGLSGDGFGFWYTKEIGQEGTVFGNKNNFDGLGIFFDTYANSRTRKTFPYIMAMVGDGNTPYDHDFDGKKTEKGGCAAEFRNKEYATKARVKYVHNSYLQVITSNLLFCLQD